MTEEELQAKIARLAVEQQETEYALRALQAANKGKGKQSASEAAPEPDVDVDDFEAQSDSGSNFADVLLGDIKVKAQIIPEHEGIFFSGTTTHAGFSVTGGHLLDVTFHDCKIENVKFENCVLINVDFNKCSLVDFGFFNIVLKNVRFDGAEFVPRSAWRDHKIIYPSPMTHPQKRFALLKSGSSVPKELTDPVWLSEQCRLAGMATTQYDELIALKLQDDMKAEKEARDARYAAQVQQEQDEDEKADWEARGWGDHWRSKNPSPSKDVKPGPWGPSLPRGSQCRHENWSADDGIWRPSKTQPAIASSSKSERDLWSNVNFLDSSACQAANARSWDMYYQAEAEKKKVQSSASSNGTGTTVGERQSGPVMSPQASSSKIKEIPHFQLNMQKKQGLTEEKLKQLNNAWPIGDGRAVGEAVRQTASTCSTTSTNPWAGYPMGDEKEMAEHNEAILVGDGLSIAARVNAKLSAKMAQSGKENIAASTVPSTSAFAPSDTTMGKSSKVTAATSTAADSAKVAAVTTFEPYSRTSWTKSKTPLIVEDDEEVPAST